MDRVESGTVSKEACFFRRAIVRRTYFGVYFVIEPTVTTAVAVLDLRQDPRVIRSLVRQRQSAS